MTFSPIAAKFIERFGPRLVSLIGGIVAALGLFITSQISTIDIMYLTYSVVFGFGSSCLYTSAYAVVPGHFIKWQSTAIGVMGSSVGISLMSSMLIKTLLSKYGWRTTFMVMGGFALASAVIGGISFVSNTTRTRGSLNDHVSNDHVTLGDDAPLWKNKQLLVCAGACFVVQFGNTIPLVHLGRYVQDVGLSSTQAAWLYIGSGVSSTVGRLCGGRLGDVMSIYSVYIYGFSCLIAGLSTISVSFTTAFPVLMVCYCVNGLAEGHYVSCGNIIIVRACSARTIARGFGLFFCVISLAYATGPVFGGWLADEVGSYVPVLQAAGAISCSGSLIISSLKCIMTTAKPRKHVPLCTGPEILYVWEKLTVL
ncbi:monocarboxylate transporter 12-B isoform X2 [Nematostella vectensis]|nr:monocarboxylate transporter 12-B isoform X2 [Nematostella vectensis]